MCSINANSDFPSEVDVNTWPPTEEQIRDIASAALNKSEKQNFKVLVYWDNPELMIYDPCHFASTEYVHKGYEYENRKVEIIIGRED